MAAGHSNDVFHHVRDALEFELPQALGGALHIPQPFGTAFPITKFMLLELVAAVLVYLIYTGLSKRLAATGQVSGTFWNFWELLAVYIRDEVVRPTIGTGHHHADDYHGAVDLDHSKLDDKAAHGAIVAPHGHEPAPAQHHSHGHAAATAYAHPADHYLPFIWSLFFFVLFCNLLGAVPFLGSPTGSIWATGALALMVFVKVLRAGIGELGVLGFLKSIVPSIKLPPAMAIVIIPALWVIELFGLLIKHCVLAIRLFANIMAGHTVVALFLAFIGMVAGSGLFYVVTPLSIGAQVAIGLLELFVAFLQAYVFAFLASLFISSAVHPH